MNERHQLRRRLARAGRTVLDHEIVDAGEGLGRDTRPVAQARDELAVVHGPAAEGGFGHACAPAEIRDTSEQRPASSLHRSLRNRIARKSSARHRWYINHTCCIAKSGMLPILA